MIGINRIAHRLRQIEIEEPLLRVGNHDGSRFTTATKAGEHHWIFHSEAHRAMETRGLVAKAAKECREPDAELTQFSYVHAALTNRLITLLCDK
jgi:hypothetical protein